MMLLSLVLVLTFTLIYVMDHIEGSDNYKEKSTPYNYKFDSMCYFKCVYRISNKISQFRGWVREISGGKGRDTKIRY